MITRTIFFLPFVLICACVSFAQNVFEREQMSLEEQWNLNDSVSKQGFFAIKKYKPVYILFGNITNKVNDRPNNGIPDANETAAIPYDNKELKFQLSMKTQALNNILGKKYGGDLWLAYTQTTRLQMFNADFSRPIREANYEPELMFIVPVKYRILGFNGTFMGIGINHQSNGRTNPYSRSWNRVIAQIALEGEHTSIVFKPWWRVPEASDVDDNQGIDNYMGRCELLFAYGKGRHDFSCISRHSLRFGNENRGSIQVDYAIRIWNHLKFHTQFFSGYGESLIDYNHRQTTFGFGLSLIEWR